MSSDTWLAIIGVALAAGSVVAAYITISPRGRRIVLLVVLLGAFIATSSITLVQRWKHSQRIDQVKREVMVLLGNRTWTAETLYKELYRISYDEVNEALMRGVKEGEFGQKRLELRSGDGELLDVRAYFVRSTSGEGDTDEPPTKR
ncbi:MAG: hypothetical protein V2A76_08720 [Planctomycetota bacterium]